MLNDSKQELAAKELEEFRRHTDQHQQMSHDLLEKYTTLLIDYKRLKDDYEETRDARERYKQLARGQERNPFVLVLIDGDGYVFDDDLVTNGADGGIKAAQFLNHAVKTSLRSRQLDHCNIMVRVYANLCGLSKALSKIKVCTADKRALAPFVANFNRTNDLFDFVDAGEYKENTNFKVRAMFRQFVDNPQCKHIFFAACHDVGYLSDLTPYISNRDQITLVRTSAFHHEFAKLGLRIEDLPNIFRSTSIPNSDLSTVGKAGIAPPTLPINSNNASVDFSSGGTLICTFYQKNMCKYGKTCKFMHVKTGTNGQPASAYLPEIRDWRTNASPNKSSMPFQRPHLAKSESDFMSGNADMLQAHVDFVTLLPREQNIPDDMIPINEKQQRLDAYIPTPLSEDRAHFNARVAKQKLCNNLHLNNYCSNGPACQYDHSEITEGMRTCLKQVAHNSPCPRRGGCRSLACLYGHICQKSDCKHRGGKIFCKLPYPMHFVDLKVVEYVLGTTSAPKDVGSQGGDKTPTSASPPPTSTSPPPMSDGEFSPSDDRAGALLNQEYPDTDGSVD